MDHPATELASYPGTKGWGTRLPLHEQNIGFLDRCIIAKPTYETHGELLKHSIIYIRVNNMSGVFLTNHISIYGDDISSLEAELKFAVLIGGLLRRCVVKCGYHCLGQGMTLTAFNCAVCPVCTVAMVTYLGCGWKLSFWGGLWGETLTVKQCQCQFQKFQNSPPPSVDL